MGNVNVNYDRCTKVAAKVPSRGGVLGGGAGAVRCDAKRVWRRRP